MTDDVARTRRMRASSVASEAWRNVLTGTTRAVTLTILAAGACGALAAADVAAIVDLSEQATQFRESGAAVHVLSSPAAVSGPRCDALGSLPGVLGAGATRQSAEQPTFLAAPRSGIATVEATVGLAGVLGIVDGTKTASGTGVAAGVWLSDSAAQTVGADVGTTLPTSAGPARVAARYVYPSDASDRSLAYSAVTPVPASGLFDACWVLAWPPSPTVDTLVRATYAGDPDDRSSATFGQLSTRLGEAFDGPALFASRTTAPAAPVAGVIGLMLGGGAVWLRRLELAAALHARVPRRAIVAQVGLELLVVMFATVLVTLPVTFLLARHGNPDGLWPAWSAGLRVTSAGAVGVLVGGVLVAATTSEARLFRYFKDR
ncbi:hypothetical protein [Cellulomonas composti]|uniref:ABC3 transporter permease protein domain-containing protein n=1 Tax=Cellulomonas composti TaxID=266130 RepID=A0A511JDF5_9CELL|nr:hypothetical protein [Cellulomonas composti]GEL95976.1 hypothetical protein CCO02nite_26340 [Cellulomonas composti]